MAYHGPYSLSHKTAVWSNPSAADTCDAKNQLAEGARRVIIPTDSLVEDPG